MTRVLSLLIPVPPIKRPRLRDEAWLERLVFLLLLHSSDLKHERLPHVRLTSETRLEQTSNHYYFGDVRAEEVKKLNKYL